MSKELNIIQAMEMPVGTEFKIIIYGKEEGEVVLKKFGENDTGVTDEASCLYWKVDSNNIFSLPSKVNVTSETINAKFILIQQPVSFMEAIKASQEGKVIKVNIGARTYTYYPRDYKWVGLIAKGTLEGLSTYEILEGKWYIEESEEN
jgi:hypothetical protein